MSDQDAVNVPKQYTNSMYCHLTLVCNSNNKLLKPSNISLNLELKLTIRSVMEKRRIIADNKKSPTDRLK